MKLKGVLLTVVVILMAAGANAQIANRNDLCQSIPNLTQEQKQKIDKLSITHQNTMDALRTQFYSESDGVKASGIKAKMNSEMKNHYQYVSDLLTPEQQAWFDQNCNATRRLGYNNTLGYGWGQG